MTPEQRALRARIAAFALHSQNDSREHTEPGRAAFLARFEHEVDPDRVLPEKERLRRAECAWRAYFTRLSYAASKARAARTAEGGDAA